MGGSVDTLDIDITPEKGGKGESLLYLLDSLGLSTSSILLAAFGDALTDL